MPHLPRCRLHPGLWVVATPWAHGGPCWLAYLTRAGLYDFQGMGDKAWGAHLAGRFDEGYTARPKAHGGPPWLKDLPTAFPPGFFPPLCFLVKHLTHMSPPLTGRGG